MYLLKPKVVQYAQSQIISEIQLSKVNSSKSDSVCYAPCNTEITFHYVKRGGVPYLAGTCYNCRTAFELHKARLTLENYQPGLQRLSSNGRRQKGDSFNSHTPIREARDGRRCCQRRGVEKGSREGKGTLIRAQAVWTIPRLALLPTLRTPSNQSVQHAGGPQPKHSF